jgi:hypothetical protein
VYLNFRYLVAVFFLLEKTRDPEGAATQYSFTRHDLPALLATHFVGDHMEGTDIDVFCGCFPRTIDGDS